MEPAVEVAFDGLDGFDNPVEFLVSGEDDKSAISPRFVYFFLGVKASVDKNLVMFFANFPVGRGKGGCRDRG